MVPMMPKFTAESTLPETPNDRERDVIARIVVPGIVREIAETFRLGQANMTVADVVTVIEHEWSMDDARYYRETIVVTADRIFVGKFCTRHDRVIWGRGATRYGYRYGERFTSAATSARFEAEVAWYRANGIELYG